VDAENILAPASLRRFGRGDPGVYVSVVLTLTVVGFGRQLLAREASYEDRSDCGFTKRLMDEDLEYCRRFLRVTHDFAETNI
jgi:hypothetical protein